MDLLGAELTGQNWTREWGGCLTHLAAPALGVWEYRTLMGEVVGKEGVFVLCTSSCIWAEPPLSSLGSEGSRLGRDLGEALKAWHWRNWHPPLDAQEAHGSESQVLL